MFVDSRFVLECIRIYVARCKEMDGRILMINTHRQQSSSCRQACSSPDLYSHRDTALNPQYFIKQH